MINRAEPQGDEAQQTGASPSPDEAESRDTDGVEVQLQAWLALGAQALTVVDRLSTVLRLELGLALADAKRLLLVLLAMIPLALFAWLGLCVMLAWLAYAASASVGLGLATFLALQIGTLLLLLRAARRFQRSLGLPATRRQWQALMRAAPAAHEGQGSRT
ncbi:MAG: hypothetical protein RIC38_07585 [Chromatocurvus sp.]